ncbi:MAG: hypothetical protein ACTS7I_00015 [Candidatus Hodgkinia cicadicola]
MKEDHCGANRSKDQIAIELRRETFPMSLTKLRCSANFFRMANEPQVSLNSKSKV